MMRIVIIINIAKDREKITIVFNEIIFNILMLPYLRPARESECSVENIKIASFEAMMKILCSYNKM